MANANQMILDTMFGMVKEKLSDKDLEALSYKSSCNLEAMSINLQTFGQFIWRQLP